MRIQTRILCGLALLLMVPLAANATSTTPTVQLVIPTIDYPASGVTGTRAVDVNNSGVIVFQLDTAAHVEFEVGIRLHNKKFVPPLTEPGALFTEPDQMNNLGTIAGEFVDSSNIAHGFTLSNGTFTTFNVTASGAYATGAFGVNDKGDLSGIYSTTTPTNHDASYVVIGGVETDFDIPGAAGDSSAAINNADLAIGDYSTTDPFIGEATCGCHGYTRSASGAINTFDPTGSVSTVPHGINNKSVVVGRYYDSASVVHGFVYFLSSKTSITYDYPSATATSLNGISDKGLIAGRYTDSSNVVHGFLAQLVM